MAWAFPLWAAKPGLFVSVLQGNATLIPPVGKSLVLTPGKLLVKGAVLEVPAGSLVKLKLAERVDLGLSGPGRLWVRELRRDARGKWEAQLALESGCLWVDNRYQFDKPLDFTLVLPDKSLPVPPRSRWLVRAGDKDQPSLTAAVEAAEGPCPDLGPWAAQGLTLLVLAEDYDQKLKQRVVPAVLGPVLLEGLRSVEGLDLAKASSAPALMRHLSAAFKSGGEGLARRVGRETGSRWVLVASAVANDLKTTEARGKKKEWVQVRAESRVLDVATGEVLAEDSTTTRVALTRQGRQAAVRQGLKAASGRLAGYLAAGLGGLVAGEPHTTRVVRVTFHDTSDKAARQLKEALGQLDSVQRVMQGRFGQGTLKLDLILRGSRRELDSGLASLKVPGLRLVREPDSEAGGPQFRVEAAR